MRQIFLVVALPFLAVVLAACGLLSSGDSPAELPGETPSPTAESILTPAAVNTPSFVIAPTVTPTNASLIIWLPPSIASRTEAGAVTLSDQLLIFNSLHPELEIIVEQKPTTGEGGALNYLRTGRAVAPSILPDLIALPVSQLAPAATEGLIFPMEEFLDPAAANQLFPAAQEWAFNEDHLVGFPFALTEMLHLEYSSIITETIPLTWTEFISDTSRHMVLPAAGSSGGRLALEFYLAAGGTLTNEAGQPALEIEPLTLALEQLYNGRSNGFILQQSSNIGNLSDGVRLVRDGSADYALTSSDVFLQTLAVEYIPQFAAVPGYDEPLPALINGWAWAITTPDLEKKTLAAELIDTLTTPENLGAWSRQSQILPAMPAALDTWPAEDPYADFAADALNNAIPMTLGGASPILSALENAVFDVISLSKTPQEAAAEAVAALEP